MKINRLDIEWALQHIVSHGDTDIFPYPFEIQFLENRSQQVVEELSKIDITQYHPISLIESLVPKSKIGFRLAHQIYPTDLVLFTALVLSISERIEAGRDSYSDGRAFSYRVMAGRETSIFDKSRKYKQWLEKIAMFTFFPTETITHVITTDISDFYSRIYRHRLENILENLSGEIKITKAIESFLKDWRSRQSFGIPVGGNASRLLAEAALNDTDYALLSEGYNFTRYVDDIVIFINTEQDPYSALSFLANHLAINEGLSLNNQKTRVTAFAAFQENLEMQSGEDDDAADESAIERLFWAAYGEDETDQEALEKLALQDLQKALEEALEEPMWDMGKIRILLRAMKLTKSVSAAEYVRDNIGALVPFAKEVVLLMEDFKLAGNTTFDGVSESIVQLLCSKALRSLHSTRAWLLELGVRGVVNFNLAQLRKLDELNGTLDVRQLQLIRRRNKDVNYFRSRKTRIDEMAPWQLPCFIYGAQCLPRDEYQNWIRSIQSRISFPLASIFLKWCVDTQEEFLQS